MVRRKAERGQENEGQGFNGIKDEKICGTNRGVPFCHCGCGHGLLSLFRNDHIRDA